jgi:pimeloyl-ACP methyl ester carboxylesterase
MLDERFLEVEDGTRVGFSVEGRGSALVLTNGLTTTTTFWKYVQPILVRRHTVIMWDLPGHGRSGPAGSELTGSVQGQPAIVARVMDAVGVRRAVQVGWSTGCQVVLEVCRRQPERCAGVALLFGPAEHVLQTTRLPVPGVVIEQLVRRLPDAAFALFCQGVSRALLAPGHLHVGRLMQLIGQHARADDVREFLGHIGRVDPRTLRILLLSLQKHSGLDVLKSLSVPLLIMAGDRDPFAPSELVGVPLHAAAPDSQLVRLADGTHTALLEEPELIAEALEALTARAFKSTR